MTSLFKPGRFRGGFLGQKTAITPVGDEDQGIAWATPPLAESRFSTIYVPPGIQYPEPPRRKGYFMPEGERGPSVPVEVFRPELVPGLKIVEPPGTFAPRPGERRRFGLMTLGTRFAPFGHNTMGQGASIPAAALEAIRGLIEAALDQAGSETTKIAAEHAGLFALPPAPILGLEGFALPELMNQVRMDAAETADAVEALKIIVDQYGSQSQVATTNGLIASLETVEASINPAQTIPIMEAHKAASVMHMKSHWGPIVEATAGLAAKVSATEGATLYPIGKDLPADQQPYAGPGTTVVLDESEFPWWILLVAGGALVAFG